MDSPDDTESFTKDLKDRALHGYQKRPTTIHKIVSGDKILPFPLDGSFYQIYHEERYNLQNLKLFCSSCSLFLLHINVSSILQRCGTYMYMEKLA